MSRHHYTHSDTLENILHDINTLTDDELETLYGISIDKEDRTVMDTVTGIQYKSVFEWASEQEEEDEWDEAAHHQTGRRFDEGF